MIYTYNIVSELISGFPQIHLKWEDLRSAAAGISLALRENNSPDDKCIYLIRQEENTAETIYDKAICIPAESWNELLPLLLELFHKYDRWYESLLEACLAEHPIQKVLSIGSELFHNPIAHFDSNGNLICWSGNFEKEYAGTIWEPVLELGCAPYEFYSIPEWRDISKITSGSSRIVRMHVHKDPDHEILGAGIAVHGKLVGTLGVTEVNEPFSEAQLDILQIIRDMLSRVYHAIGAGREMDHSHSLLSRLIEGKRISRSAKAQYMKQSGLSQGENLRLLCFSERNANESRLLYFAQKTIKCCPGSVFFQVGGTAVLLFHNTILDEDAIYRIRTDAAKNEIFAVLSVPFRSLEYIKEVFNACKYALGVMDTEGLSFYEKLHLKIISNTICETHDERSLVHPLLLEWIDTQEAGRDWAEELFVYLQCGQNLSMASQKCHIHRSTMAYHMERLQQYLDLDFAAISTDLWLYLLLSVKMILDS